MKGLERKLEQYSSLTVEQESKTMKTKTHDFCLTFLKKGAVIPARLVPDTMDSQGLSFTYEQDAHTNYTINMDRNGRFSAERFAFIEDCGWDVVEGYNHNEAKELAYLAGIIYPKGTSAEAIALLLKTN